MIADEQIDQLLGRLTLEEKASLCSGATFWATRALAEKGIPSVRMSDGPTGLRKEAPEQVKENGGPSVKATCFPTESTLACSWDPALTDAIGQAIGAECRAEGVTTLLAPGVNIKRSPLCGRNFEYYSEDPLLSGTLACGMIGGLKKQGVGCSLKHFAANNQETLRMTISSELDERALHEIYLRPFEIAVRQAAPSTVMCSYNRVGGVYSSENKKLLTEILRNRWGFDGIVMSDWGAVNDRVEGIRAGLDLEMPTSGEVNNDLIVKAVQEGTLEEEELNRVVRRLLRFILTAAEHNETVPCDAQAGHLLAVRALERSAVLLKNEGVLPLAAEQKVLFVGQMAQMPRYQGGGSSIVNARALKSPLEAAQEQGRKVAFSLGWSEHAGSSKQKVLLNDAVEAAAQNDLVVLFIGLTDAFENEGRDRQHLSIPEDQIALIRALHNTGKPIVAVLSGGSPVETPWLDQVDALLYLALGGEGVGEAACRLLWGEVNPSGKLAESWPICLEDTPSYYHFPMGPRYVSYNESIFVGYRYYDTARKAVRFPFGFGLSYTRFAYSQLNVSSTYGGEGELSLSFQVTNTGELAGSEICQCYLHRENSKAFQCEQELVGFARVTLQPGETKQVSLKLPRRAFCFYSTAAEDFVLENGTYELRVGPSSRDLPLSAQMVIVGQGPVPLDNAYLADSPFGNLQDNQFPDEWFCNLHPLPQQENRAAVPGEFDLTTPLRELTVRWPGRLLHRIARMVAKKSISFAASKKLNRELVVRMVDELPLKNTVLMSGGILKYETANALVALCNGKGSVLQLLSSFSKKSKK